MSRETAMAEAQKLKAIMATHGVRASIELQVGRPYAAGDDWLTRKHALINHHTAGSKSGLTPSLALVKRGRSDLPGPLANGYGGRDFVYRIITLGLANHPGLGGPLTLAGFTIPKDSARISTWGTEWEHDGVSRWPEDMREFMGRSNAALLEYLGAPVARSIEHSTWAPRRKVDRSGYSAATGQAEIRAWAGQQAATQSEEDDMRSTDQIKLSPSGQKLLGREASPVADLLQGWSPGVRAARNEIALGFAAQRAQLDALTKAVTALAAASPADVKQAFAEGLTDFRAALAQELESIEINVTTTTGQ